MATTPMSYIVEMKWGDICKHPLGEMWVDIPSDHPTYGSTESFTLFLKQEYNINMISVYMEPLIEFESEQDYILWKLHQ